MNLKKIGHFPKLVNRPLMQFYALDEDLPILAAHAARHKDYRCPECGSTIRLRKGQERRPHFYHPTTPLHCHQHNKSLIHLQTQWTIHALLPLKEAQMERIFPEINRVADVAWEGAKIIFEIQYSPISMQEAQARCRDYQKIGYTPIWILHDKRFNRHKISAAESFLREIGCYYTNIDEKGHGEIYDQFDILIGNRRIYRGPPLSINLLKPSKFEELLLPVIESAILPKLLTLRRRSWPLYFSLDLWDRFQQTPSSSMLELERKFCKTPERLSCFKIFGLCYKIVFRILLEIVCRG